MRDALDSAVIAIGASGSESARLDAELLLARATGVTRAELVSDSRREVESAHVRAFQDLVRRRSAGHEPVAYLLGSKGFRHIELHVDPRALVPRPETELLVEVGLELEPGARVLDVGTGSGAVALALKHERPDLVVGGSDVSAEALALARENVATLKLDVALMRADLLGGALGTWDAILSNPPYVAEHERAALPADVRDHEPGLALFGGEDGLDVVRRLVDQAAAAPAVRLLALEIGAGQAGEVALLLERAGFTRTERRRDLAGIERVLVGRR